MRLTLLALLLTALPSFAFEPDPATVRRCGPAYRYPQHGWIVLHIEGDPYERGFQHGTLLAREINDFVFSLAVQQSKKAPEDAWTITRTMVSAVFLRKFDREWLEEMQGIADGAAKQGAKFNGRPVDLLDIVCINVQLEYETLDNATDATPTGLEGLRFPHPAAKPPQKPGADHCSAFAATGPATADGKMVIGHITMSGLANALASNVWLDIKPKKGHRIGMQGFPAAIWSAQDYYLNSAGLALTETTIKQTQFNANGTPLAGRCRQAMQYGNSIDDIVKILLEKNNGLYTNEWLIGDANTNEIAMLELGTNAHTLRRSSKNEWLTKDTEGFYWGCNNTKDLEVRKDTYPTMRGRPQDLSWVPSDRDRKWLKLFDQHHGKIDANFGKLAFATPPLAAIHSLDAKVTTSDMAKKLESHIVFGPPSQRVWEMTWKEKEKYSDPRSLVPNDWTVVSTAALKESATVDAIDFRDKLPKMLEDLPTKPAWHGTLLPKTDDDVWLTAGFAAYERIVALENAFHEKSGPILNARQKAKIELALFQHRAAFMAGKSHQDKGTNPFRETIERNEHAYRVGFGVHVLYSLHRRCNHETFISLMNEIGNNYSEKEISVDQFQGLVQSSLGKLLLPEKDRHFPNAEERPVNLLAWQDNPENTIIVYGAAADIAGNKAAAHELDKAFRVKWWNGDLTILADKDATEEKLKGKHVLLIGRPASNSLTKKFEKQFPVKFGPASATVNGDLYAHERTAVIAAGVNPVDPRYSMIAIAGFSADATYCAAQQFVHAPAAQILVFPRGQAAVPMVAK